VGEIARGPGRAPLPDAGARVLGDAAAIFTIAFLGIFGQKLKIRLIK